MDRSPTDQWQEVVEEVGRFRIQGQAGPQHVTAVVGIEYRDRFGQAVIRQDVVAVLEGTRRREGSADGTARRVRRYERRNSSQPGS